MKHNRRSFFRRILWVALLAIFSLPAGVHAQGYSPEEAARRMTVADGFAVDLVASEPLVRQPVAIDFDDRGRLWVLQYLQYPNPAGLNRVKVDRYSRTTYDRVPEPPPRGPVGADRLTILDDTDHDGRMDKSRDFVSGLNLASGFAFGNGGVFVLQVPYLLFYPDRDHDDVPDADPEVLLQGFGMEDSSSLANSLVFGPDGWLYGTQGTNIRANIRGIEFEQGIWRYAPRTGQFELVAEGGGNMWGLDFDHHGRLLAGTNYGGFLMLHIVPGAYYVKSFAKHGELHNPFAFGYFDHVPHRDFQGGHVTVGGFLYDGDTFPESIRNSYIAADTLGHSVRWHRVVPTGSTVRTENGGVLLQANDTWFAPSDTTQGPDGAVYVADWYDQRTAHPDPDATWDRSNGRIYRIRDASQGVNNLQASSELQSLSDRQLFDRTASRNGWHVRRARRILSERKDSQTRDTVQQRLAREVPTPGQANPDSKDPMVLQLLWTTYGCGGFDESIAAMLLKHRNEDVRAWAVRLLAEHGDVSVEMRRTLLALAAKDASPVVVSQLASSAQRLPAELAIPLIKTIASRAEFLKDPYIPLLCWWSMERNAAAATPQLLAEFASPQAWQTPIIRDELLGRLMRRYAGDGGRPGLEACARLLEAAPDDVQRRRMVGELDSGLKLVGHQRSEGLPPGTAFTNLAAPAGRNESRPRPPAEIPAALVQSINKQWEADPSDPLMLRVAIRLGNAKAYDRTIDGVRDRNATNDTRLAMLSVLDELGKPSCVDTVLALVAPREPETIQLAAMRLLGRFSDERIATHLLAAYPTMNATLRGANRNVLLARRSSALQLLHEIDVGKIPSSEMTVDELRGAALLQDSDVDALVRKHWGGIRAGTPEEKLAEIRRINNDLRAASGDLARGRQLFEKHCATCHKLFGQGTTIGPDLTTANRKDQEFVLVSMVDPSAQIRKEFLSYVATTIDGRIVTGLLVEESPASVTLLGAKNERITLARDAIDELNASSTSLMPENVLQPFQPQDVRDLFRYLRDGH